MAKRILTSIRFDEGKLEIIKKREGIESAQGCVDFMIERYYSAYGIEDNFFLREGVPKIDESNENKIKVQSVQRKPKDKTDVSVIGDKKDGGEVGVVTKMYGNKAVKGRYDEKGLFKRF